MTDQILYWNAVAIEAVRISHSEKDPSYATVNGPTLSSRALAIVHLAMYEACIGVAIANGTAGLTPYLTAPLIATAGASQQTAIATAAHAMLSKLYPKLKAFFDAQHNGAGLISTGYDAGYEYGKNVAREIWKLRSNDPSDSDDGFSSSIAKGKHRPDPNNSQPFNAPFYGSQSTCFAVTKRWGIKKPYDVGTTKYNAALKQVRGKGIKPELMGTLPSGFSKRTSDETVIGIFWGYDGAKGLGTPPRFFNQIIRQVAIEKNNSELDNARLFALANVAMGDAGILSWDQKYIHNFWRPILGIRENDNSMGPIGTANNSVGTNCDPNWLPLGAPKTNVKGENDFTPPFPAYPSGHATFGAAALHITRLFYGIPLGNRSQDTIFKDSGGNNMGLVSEEFNGVNTDSNGTIRPKHTRSFPKGLWQMIEENGFSRVYLGVHWYFDAFDLQANGNAKIQTSTVNPNEVGIGGAPLGVVIAEDIFTNGLKQSAVGPR